MSTNLQEMQQRVAKSQGQTSVKSTSMNSTPPAPDGATSLAEMQKRLAPKPPGPLTIAGAVGKDVLTQGLKPYVDNFKAAAQDYVKTIEDDRERSKQVPSLLNAAKGLYDILNIAGPVASIGQTGIVDPLKKLISSVGGVLSSAASSEDNRTPEQRREGAEIVKPRLDLKVHKEDVKQTVDSINSGLDALYGAAVMTAGGKVLGGEAPKELPPAGSYEALPRLSADETEDLIRSGRRAKGLNPVVGKPQVTLADIKPKVTLAQAQAGIRERTAALTEPTINEASLQKLDIEPMAADGGRRAKLETSTIPLDLVHAQMDIATHPLVTRVLKETDGVTTGGVMLDHLSNVLKQVHNGEAMRAVVDGLNKFTKDVKVVFEPDLPKWKGKDIAGYYDPESHEVRVSVRGASNHLTHTIIHELRHAATSRYVKQNPDSPLVKRLSLLLQEVKKRALRMGELHQLEDAQSAAPRLRHYGLTNEREFLSELDSNPDFKDFLARSEAHASPSWKGIKIFNYIADMFRRMLGIKDPRATPILHEGMFLSKEIAERQAGGHLVALTRRMTSEVLRSEPEFMPSVVDKAQKELGSWLTDVLKVVNPEALSREARAGGAVVAKAIADRTRSTTRFTRSSGPRSLWWEARKGLVDDFYDRFEKGDEFKNDPELARIANDYRRWTGQVFIQDISHKIIYEPEENYLFHVFQESDEFRKWADQKFKRKWGDPGFTKNRVFSMYAEARDAGFTPKYDNPEDLMLARQHASDIAVSKVNTLEELGRWGLAVKKPSGIPASSFRTKFPSVLRRSPNGDWFYVNQDVDKVLYNAFDSYSLWASSNIVGKGFRGMMAVKNNIVPLRLGFSLFHALHVLHIANADMTAMSLKGMLAGTQGVVKTGVDFARAVPLFVNGWKNARLGAGIVEAYLGKIPEEELTAADQQNLQYMSEGGFVPVMSQHWTVGSIAAMRKGIAQAKGGSKLGAVKAVWHTPWALMEGLQAPIFQQWVPNLKAASYLKNVAEALKADPSLINNQLKRQQAFRRIAQSVDNRYGEMNYETLLWQKWAKDVAVLNTLSLGWQMGFIREYGGGGLDLGQFAVRGGRMQAIKEGKLDRALFASVYTMTALGYGGLLTWAMTGKPPESLTDYVLPRTGGANADGSPARVNTMFYTREFQSIAKHVQAQGLEHGLGTLVESKASGVIGLFAELAKGVNSFGQEIQDPGAPAYQRLEQSLAYVMSDMAPIAFKSMEGDPGSIARGVLGFTPAPAYMTDSATVGRIKDSYRRFVQPQEKPYDRLARSKAFQDIRKDYANGKPIGEKLDALSTEGNLSSREQRQLMKDLNTNEPVSLFMFTRLPWEQQKILLDQMSSEERQTYLRHSNKQHLRGHYAAPGT